MDGAMATGEMTRRRFFWALPIGGATLPTVLRTVSTPQPWAQIWMGNGDQWRNLTIRAKEIWLNHRVVIDRCRFQFPWNGQGIRAGTTVKAVSITNSVIVQESPPLWVRLLRLR